MRQPVSDSDDSGNAGFQTIVDGFLLQPGLPFADVLTAQKIKRIFRKQDKKGTLYLSAKVNGPFVFPSF